MDNKQSIKRYALSIYDTGKQDEKLDDIQTGLESIKSLYKTVKEFKYLLLTKKIDTQNKTLILEETLRDYCSGYVIALLSVIIDNGDSKHLMPIIDRFFIILENESDIVNVKMVTSDQLSDQDLNSLSQDIEKQLGKKISFKHEQDPQILGGVKLMIGNKVVDGSISYQLKKLKFALEQV